MTQEEGKIIDTEESSTLSFDKSMRHSASQLLSGIARDVGSTTSLMLESKSSDNLGGLNLLATVSKYMNAETCNKSDKTAINEAAEQCPVADRINGWELAGNHELTNADAKINEIKRDISEQTSSIADQDTRQSVPKVKIMAVTSVKLLSLPTTAENVSQNAKLMQVIQPPFGQNNKTVSSESSQNLISQPIKISCSKNSVLGSGSSVDPTGPDYVTCSSLSVVSEARPENTAEVTGSVNENLCVSSYTEPNSTNSLTNCQISSGLLKNPLSSVSHNMGVMDDHEKGKVTEDPCKMKQALASNSHSFLMSSNTTLPKTTSSSPPSLSGSGVDVQHLKNSSLLSNSCSYLAQPHADLLHDQTSYFGMAQAGLAKTPLIALTSKPTVKCDPNLPGKVVTEALPRNHLTASNKINLSQASAVPNPAPNKSIQVIKVTNTAAQLQLRSVSCMSGKTYLVLTSSTTQPAVSSDSESSTSTRILPFSEL